MAGAPKIQTNITKRACNVRFDCPASRLQRATEQQLELDRSSIPIVRLTSSKASCIPHLQFLSFKLYISRHAYPQSTREFCRRYLFVRAILQPCFLVDLSKFK